MCCNELEELKIKKTASSNWRLYDPPSSFLCFYICVSIITIKSKGSSKEREHTGHRNLWLPPCGVARGFYSWIKLHKNCSLTLNRRGHKSTSKVIVTLQLLDEFFRVLLISSSSLTLYYMKEMEITVRVMMLAFLLWCLDHSQMCRLVMIAIQQKMTKNVCLFLCHGTTLRHIFTAVNIENIIWLYFAGVATFPCLINFSEQRGSLRFCFLLFSCILSASHSMILASASLESLPKHWENRGWRNSFHASWIQHFFFGPMICFASLWVWNLLWRAHSPALFRSIFCCLSFIYITFSLYSSFFFSQTQIYS